MITQYDGKEVCPPSQSQVNVRGSVRLHSQDGVSQEEEDDPLSLPLLRFFIRGMRVLSLILVLLPFLHSLRSPRRSCFIVSPSGTLNLHNNT